MTEPRTIYFAGELFSIKHLLGNAFLAAAIEEQSEQRYTCIVPQDLEQREVTATAIRNQDLLHVISSDLGLFNFDGPELDSGTVVEFMIAKMLDIPAVILRTDFRAAGDAKIEPWNLMLSGYPRTEVIVVDSMAMYQRELRIEKRSPVEAAETIARSLADRVVAAFDAVCDRPAIMSPDVRSHLYSWVREFPGANFGSVLTKKIANDILLEKIRRGVL